MLINALSVTTAIIVGCSVTCRPAWYQPAAVDYSKLDDDKRDLTNLIDRIGAALNRRQPIDFELTQEQMNRWLAARLEVPLGERIAVEGIERPYVEFLDGGRARVGAMTNRGGFGVVASLTLRPELAGDELVTHWDAVHLGTARIPWNLIDIVLRKQLPPEAIQHFQPDGSLLAPNDFTWPNGDRRYRLAKLEISRGIAKLRLEPR